MIFDYGTIYDIPLEIPNPTKEQKHWLAFELPSAESIRRKLFQLDYPEADAWLKTIQLGVEKGKIDQFIGEVGMCCYFLWNTPTGRWNIKRQKYSSIDLAQKVQEYSKAHSYKPDTISPVAFDVAALCRWLPSKKARWTPYRAYPHLSQTQFPT